MLLTDGFGGVGGIAEFNRNFLRALNDCSRVERVQALPRLIRRPIDRRSVPEAVVYDRVAAQGKAAYVFQLVMRLVQNPKIDLLVCGHINLVPLAWVAARICRARLVLIIHGIEAWTPRKMFARTFAKRIDAVISVSRFSAGHFARWANFPFESVFILPNCVDLKKFRPQKKNTALLARYGLESSRVLLTVGRLESGEYKGFDEVIEALPQLLYRYPNIKYLIVGDGPDRARLKSKVEALGLGGVVSFAGYIEESEKVDYYNIADVYVMPSSGEGFGIVLIEAAACGLPVVGSSVDGSREALQDGKLGLLVDPKQSNQLVQAVGSFLEADQTHSRLDGVDIFSTGAFSKRVAEWCRTQAASCMQSH